ncbi:MAG: hypothetical protein OEQ53_17030, partial [Saprospiraceae bacterium]|nr:hypothetical protein [Saprospiraceae bacterium]
MRFFLLVYLLGLLSCQAQKQMVACQHSALVLDLHDLDGCELLLELANGKKLIPMNASEFSLQAGQSIKLDYTVM